MSKNAHTPGPWKVHEIAPDDPKWEAFEVWNEAASSNMIANGAGSASMRVFGIANARLISAAPDLLAALEMAEPFLQIMRRRREQVGLEGPTLDTVIDMVNAAISKAKGEA